MSPYKTRPAAARHRTDIDWIYPANATDYVDIVARGKDIRDVWRPRVAWVYDENKITNVRQSWRKRIPARLGLCEYINPSPQKKTTSILTPLRNVYLSVISW